MVEVTQSVQYKSHEYNRVWTIRVQSHYVLDYFRIKKKRRRSGRKSHGKTDEKKRLSHVLFLRTDKGRDKWEEYRSTLVYYESIKRDLNIRLIYECRCDERIKTKTEGSTRLTYTGLCGGLEHLKITTRLIDERFASVMCGCGIVTLHCLL
jgi:hypothetical protein